MKRPIAPLSGEWMEIVCLKPSACQCLACCLEPNEILLITLAATDPFDAALVDWEDYQLWNTSGAEGMPSGDRFANDTRSVVWKGQAVNPPYIAVLVIMNPGQRESCITVEAKIEMVRARKPPTSSTTTEGKQPSDSEVGCRSTCRQRQGNREPGEPIPPRCLASTPVKNKVANRR